MKSTVTIGGVAYEVAPLKALQVAAFFDANDFAQKNGETKVEFYTRSLRIIAQALKNANPKAILLGASEDESVVRINEAGSYVETTNAFVTVMEISGLRVTSQGEATAAGSTLSESSAAS